MCNKCHNMSHVSSYTIPCNNCHKMSHCVIIMCNNCHNMSHCVEVSTCRCTCTCTCTSTCTDLYTMWHIMTVITHYDDTMWHFMTVITRYCVWWHMWHIMTFITQYDTLCMMQHDILWQCITQYWYNTTYQYIYMYM